MDLLKSLHKINGGRLSRILDVLDINECCAKCNHFNLSIKDFRQSYRCACIPSCIGATLSLRAISYINQELGWISIDEHMMNLRK